MTLHFFVGYDPREELAWQVLRHSVSTRSSEPVKFYALRHRELRRLGLFRRTWWVDADGQYYDDQDGRPFSTEFSHTRFLVPELARLMGLTGWVVFVDLDFVFRADVAQLREFMRPEHAVAVVKHDWTSLKEGHKMDGVRQQRYYRKLWSSLVLWNLDHPANDAVTTYMVNRQPGSYLHAFSWLQDEQIGAVDPRWNWIPDVSDPGLKPYAVHYSLRSPWLGDDRVAYAQLWRDEYQSWIDHMSRSKIAQDPSVPIFDTIPGVPDGTR